MAILIQFNQAPSKHFLKKKLQFMPYHSWLGHKHLDRRHRELSKLEQRIAEVRLMAKRFERDSTEQFDKGFRFTQAELVLETLELFIHGQKNRKHEASALKEAARKIAKNILGQEVDTPVEIDQIDSDFFLSFLVSGTQALEFKKNYRVICDLLGQDELFFITEGPSLFRAVTPLKSLEIPISEADIADILNKLLNRF